MLIVTKTKNVYFSPLSADDLFDDLSPKSSEFLTRIKRTERFKKDSIIYTAGEMPSGFYVLLKGRIQLRSNDERVARLIKPKEIFGLVETITDLPYESTAETLTSAICEYIGREDFVRFLQSESEISFRLLRELSMNLQKNCQTLFSSTI
jgi:CRP-like cAMP-binding protein